MNYKNWSKGGTVRSCWTTVCGCFRWITKIEVKEEQLEVVEQQYVDALDDTSIEVKEEQLEVVEQKYELQKL